MSEANTPREVVSRLIDSFAAGRFAEVAELYSEDCVLEIRFALPAGQVVRGGEAIRALARTADPETFRKTTVADLVLHDTADPEVIIAEWDYVGEGSDGKPFRHGNIIVVRVRDGKVVHSRDYHNHVARAAAVGKLPDLLKSLDVNPH